MYDFVKYLPLEWRKRSDFCVPKGPGMPTFRRTVLFFAGSRLAFKAPRHSPTPRTIPQQRVLPGHDALQNRLYKSYSSGAMANDHWGFSIPFARRWAFWGPWMTGAKAQLRMAVSAVGRYDEFALPDVSFFNPRAFEMVLLNYFNDAWGHKHWGGENADVARYWGPTDWQTHNHLPVFSVSCTVHNLGADGKTKFSPEHLFFLPVTHKHFVQISFKPDVFDSQGGKPTFDTTPIQELQDAILSSITLELSPEAQAAYDKIKAECPDMKLSDHFPPLKWPTESSEAGEADQRLRNEEHLNRLSS